MKRILYFFTIASLTLVSCTDESTFSNPVTHQLERGAFVRFNNMDAILDMYPDPQDINISEGIYDANGNVSSYSLTVTANIGGNLYTGEDFLTITSFPATLNITSQMLADALGVDVSEFFYGDTFNFVAKATRNDGVVFYGQTPTFSSSTGTVGVGNTQSQLIDVSSYKNAMTFGFVLFTDCPPVPGVYEIVMHDSYGDGWQGQGVAVTVDGVTQLAMLCDYWGDWTAYQDGCLPGAYGVYDLVIPSGTQSWSWNWTGDWYPSECSFEVYAPNGTQIFSAASPAAGMLPVINCL